MRMYVCPSCISNTTLVSSASVGPHISFVIYPSEPCVDFQWGDKETVVPASANHRDDTWVDIHATGS